MKVGVLTNAFYEESFMKNCLAQFEQFNVDHIVLNSAKPWNGSYSRGVDFTSNICQDFNVPCFRYEWETEAEQFNWGMAYFGSYDWVIICDADERYTQNGIHALLDLLEIAKDSETNAIITKTWHVYWKSLDYELMPPQTDYPLIAVKPNGHFVHARSFDGLAGWVSVPMYHLSYVRTDEEMKKKVSSFTHASEFENNEWYENVWLKWTPEMENLHPVVPEQFKKAIYKPAPEEIKV